MFLSHKYNIYTVLLSIHVTTYNIFYVKKCAFLLSISPENFGRRGLMVDITCQHKEIIRQTIDVTLYMLSYTMRLGKSAYTPFGTTTHGTTHMCLRSSRGTASGRSHTKRQISFKSRKPLRHSGRYTLSSRLSQAGHRLR